MKQAKNKNKPWLDERGFELSKQELKRVSKSWSPKVWDEYLHSIETPRAESLLRYPLETYHQFENDDGDSTALDIYPWYTEMNVGLDTNELAEQEVQRNYEEHRYKLIQNMLKSLGPRQKQVIELHYLEGRSLGEISQMLRLGKSTVQGYADAGIHQLKKSYGVRPPYIEGKNVLKHKTTPKKGAIEHENTL